MTAFPFLSILVFSPSPNTAILCRTRINTQALLVCPQETCCLKSTVGLKCYVSLRTRTELLLSSPISSVSINQSLALGTPCFTHSCEKEMTCFSHFGDSHAMNPLEAGTSAC